MRFSRDWDKYAANIYLWLNILQTSTNMEDIHISVQRYGLLASLYCLSLISYLYHNDRYLHAFSFVSSRHHGMFDVEGKFSSPPMLLAIWQEPECGLVKGRLWERSGGLLIFPCHHGQQAHRWCALFKAQAARYRLFRPLQHVVAAVCILLYLFYTTPNLFYG